MNECVISGISPYRNITTQHTNRVDTYVHTQTVNRTRKIRQNKAGMYIRENLMHAKNSCFTVCAAVFAEGYRTCSEGEIRCRSGQCIGAAQFCAGLISCADDSVYIDDNVCRQYFPVHILSSFHKCFRHS